MWNPFAKDRPGEMASPSMVPPTPGVMPPAGAGQPLHLPPEQAGGAVHPAAGGSAGRPDAPAGHGTTAPATTGEAGETGAAGAAAADDAARNRIADVQMMGTTAVATVTVTELSHDSGAHQLADLLNELSDTGAEDFVLDLNSVQFMDSACLGCLVEALNRLAARGGRIALANGNHSVQYLFRLTRLDRVFVICPDVLSALQQMERRRAG